MNSKFINRVIASMIFIISAIQFLTTAQPSVSFWDPGELSSAAYHLEVPHPPGGPFFSLLGRLFYMLPIPGNIGYRMNALSAISAACAVALLYLVAVRLIEIYKGRKPQNPWEMIATYGSAAIGAFAFSCSDTLWFNSAESNVFAASLCMFTLMTWLALVWYEKSESPYSWKYIFLIAYLLGLSIGIHLMSILATATIVMIVVFKRFITDEKLCKRSSYIFWGHIAVMIVVALMMWSKLTSPTPPGVDEYKEYDKNFLLIMGGISVVVLLVFKKYVFNKSSFYLAVLCGGIAVALVFAGVVKLLPSFLSTVAGDSSSAGLITLIFILAALGAVVYWSIKKRKTVLFVATLSTMFIIAGFTIYTLIIIRSGANPPMNENNPNSFSRLITYLNREQYGDWPIFKRRWSGEPQHQDTWTNYSSDLDFFWRYQMDHMFNRYLLWNFAGRESWDQDAGVRWSQLYGIPFFVGLLGLFFHYRKDWKMATAFFILFLFGGYLTVFYQNQQQWQPRERDYFYTGAFFVFAIWIALGIRGLLDLVEKKMKTTDSAKATIAGILIVGAVFIPARMFQTNYFTHDRSKDWVPWDYSYNLLQSCAPDAILFTNGDNDTFPLWYLQEVEGIRTDVRTVNLSLVNTEWYIKQLKNETPHDAKKVKMSFSDPTIDKLEPTAWEPQRITLSVPRKTIIEDQATHAGIFDSTVLNAGAIVFTMPATLHEGGVNGIRVQDIMVRDIIEQNAWDRPIYFANTCSPDTKIGLDDYIRVEGLAGRLVPTKKPANSSEVFYIDEHRMEDNFLNDHPTISKTYQPGFLFRGLNDKSIFYDENHMRMIKNFRETFLVLTDHYLSGNPNKSMAIKTLDRLEQLMPRNVITMDYRSNFDLAQLYYYAGDTLKFRNISSDVEKEIQTKLSQNVADPNEIGTFYQILNQIYEQTGQYSKAVASLQQLLLLDPNNQQVQNEINRIKSLPDQPQTAAPNQP